MIFDVLDTVAANTTLLRDTTSPQGKATRWIIEEDRFLVCPDDPKLIQRWVLGTMYFATGGDNWLQCSNNPSATDLCGSQSPFFGDVRFLAAVNECQWAGIVCNMDLCVTEIEFGECFVEEGVMAFL